MKEIKITITDTGKPIIKVRLEVFDLGDTATDREDNVADSITEAVFKQPQVRSIRDLMPGRTGAPPDKAAFLGEQANQRIPDPRMSDDWAKSEAIEEKGEPSF